MNCYVIIMYGQKINVESEFDLCFFFDYWKLFPPFKEVKISIGTSSSKFLLKISKSNNISIKYINNTIHFKSNLTKLKNGEVLLYSILPFIELQNQKEGIVTMHGAAISLNNKAIMLIGKQGAGKTITTLNLCQKHGAKLIGNDLIRIKSSNNKLTVNGGSKYFYLRYESIKRNIPELAILFSKKKEDGWIDKVFKEPHELDIVVKNTPTVIYHSYLIHIDETKNKLYVNDIQKLSTQLYLNENLSRYIRGTSIALFTNKLDFWDYVPSLDSPDLFKMRVSIIKQIINPLKIKYISGNLAMVTQEIIKNI